MKLQSFTSYQQVYQDIKNKIEQGKYAVGDKLPSVAELCNVYQVSNITIRQALDLLKNQDYIYSKRRIGNYVKKRDNEIYRIAFNYYNICQYPVTDVRLKSVDITDIAEIQPYLGDITLKDGVSILKCVQVYCYREMPMVYETIYLPVNAKLKHLYVHHSQLGKLITNVLNNYDIAKRMSLSVMRTNETINQQLYLDQQEVIFQVIVKFYAQTGHFAGVSVGYVSASDTQIEFS